MGVKGEEMSSSERRVLLVIGGCVLVFVIAVAACRIWDRVSYANHAAEQEKLAEQVSEEYDKQHSFYVVGGSASEGAGSEYKQGLSTYRDYLNWDGSLKITANDLYGPYDSCAEAVEARGLDEVSYEDAPEVADGRHIFVLSADVENVDAEPKFEMRPGARWFLFDFLYLTARDDEYGQLRGSDGAPSNASIPSEMGFFALEKGEKRTYNLIYSVAPNDDGGFDDMRLVVRAPGGNLPSESLGLLGDDARQPEDTGSITVKLGSPKK